MQGGAGRATGYVRDVPFTISHLAAAKPIDSLLGRQLPMIALAVGAMAPDFEFFIRGRIERTIGHTVHGALLIDVPLGLLFLAALTWLIVPAICSLLSAEDRYLAPAIERSFTVPRGMWSSPSGLARIVLALLIGIGSHLLWDVFTQPTPVGADGVRVASLAWLDWFPFSIGEADFALHSVLHWLSSAFGLVVLMVAVDRWLERQARPGPGDEVTTATRPTPTRSPMRLIGWGLVIATTGAFLIQHPAPLLDSGPARPTGLAEQLATAAVWALAGCFVGLALFGLLLQVGFLPSGASVPRPPDPYRRAGTRHEAGDPCRVEADRGSELAGGEDLVDDSATDPPQPEPLRGPSVKGSPLGPGSRRAQR